MPSEQGHLHRRTDGASALTPQWLRGALYVPEQSRVASNDAALTGFVHTGVERSSRAQLAQVAA